MEIVFAERHVLFWRKVRVNSSFRVGDSKKPNFQPENSRTSTLLAFNLEQRRNLGTSHYKATLFS